MAQNDLSIRSSLLTTNDKLPDRFLFSGKVEAKNCGGNFLFYLFEIASPWSSACVKIKKNVLDILEKRFNPQNLGDEEAIFERILQEINQSLNALAQKGENSWIGNLNSIMGLVSGNEICIAQAGRFSGYIFRKGKISSLTENSHLKEDPHPLKTFSDITTGRLAQEDRIVFGNMELYNHFSLDRIRKTVEQSSANASLQELYRALKRNKITSVNAIIIEARPCAKSEEIQQGEAVEDLPEIIELDKQEESFAKKMAKKYSPVMKSYYEKTKTALAEAGKTFKDQSGAHKQEREISPQHGGILNKGMEFLGNSYSSAKKLIAPQLKKIQNSDQYQKIKIKTFPHTNKASNRTNKFLRNFDFVLVFFRFILLKNNRKYLYGVLVILLIFFGYLKVKSNNSGHEEAKRQQEIALAYDKAKEAYGKASEDLALGKTNDLKPLEDALAMAKTAQESPATKDKAVELAKQIQTSLDKQTKTTRLFNPKAATTFSDSVHRIVLAGMDIYGFDDGGKIYMANTGEESPRLVASIGKENSGIVSASYSSSLDKVFLYTNGKVVSYDITSKTQGELKVTDGSGKWEDARAISSFVSNIYLLDSSNGQLWKHVESDNGYGKGTAYATGNKVSLKGAVDMAVDGNIYVLLGDGNVAKFSKGSYDSTFSLKPIMGNSKLESPAKIYTDADTNYIFVLDKKNNRIARFDKTGNFVNQYSIDGTNIDDFVVNGKVEKLWMLSGGKIYSIDL